MRITAQAKIISLLPFVPLYSGTTKPPGEEMIRLMEATGCDLSLDNLEIVTARLVSELELRDEIEEGVRAISLHGLLGGDKRKKKFV